MSTKLLEVSGISVAFKARENLWNRKKINKTVVDQLSFSVAEGEILGVVGESGCGKSMTSLSVMGLLPTGGKVIEGEILLNGRDILKLSEWELDQIRGNEIAMVFQDALASLNPVFTIGYQVTEACMAHSDLSRQEAKKKALGLLEAVGIPDPQTAMKKYPFALSGGQRQRVMIAMAISGNPRLLIADEATTALDVTIQAQIMRMLRKLHREKDLSLLLITHDIGLVAEMADRVMVMYAGQVVEEADVYTLFAHPGHPYTQALLAAVPDILDAPQKRLSSIKGTVPADYFELTGCRFFDRCPFAGKGCQELQEMRPVEEGHYVRCHRGDCQQSKKLEAEERSWQNNRH